MLWCYTMSNKFKKMLPLRVAIVVMIGIITMETRTQACSCMQTHPQDIYCNNQKFVIGVFVKSSVVINGSFPGTGQRQILVNVLYDFKGTGISGDITLLTAEHSATCGVELAINECYVISGTVDSESPGSYHINLCGFIRRCSQVTLTQYIGFFGKYGENCGCEISNASDGTCPLAYDSIYDNSCLVNHAICEGNVAPRCKNGKNCLSTDCQWTVAANPNGQCIKG